jgi:hypothetical protein
MAKKSAKAKAPQGWRWRTNQEGILSYTGGHGWTVVIEEVVRNGATVYVAMAVHHAADDASDDRVVELGTFDRFLAADNVAAVYISQLTGEPIPDWAPFDPTATD